MFIPSTFKRPVSSWKALNLRKTLLMASSVRLKPLNCSRLPCVYAQETLTFLLTQKKTCVSKNVSVSCADRKSGSAGMPRPSSYAVFCLKKKKPDHLGLLPRRRRGRLLLPVPGQRCFFFHDTPATGIYTLSLHDALPICPVKAAELFAFTLRVRAGNTDVLTDAEENVRQ